MARPRIACRSAATLSRPTRARLSTQPVTRHAQTPSTTQTRSRAVLGASTVPMPSVARRVCYACNASAFACHIPNHPSLLSGNCKTRLTTAGPGVDLYACGAFTELSPGSTCQVRCQNGYAAVSGSPTSDFVCDYGPLVQSNLTAPLRCERLCDNVTCSAYNYTVNGVKLPYQPKAGLNPQVTCQTINGNEDCITPCCAPRMFNYLHLLCVHVHLLMTPTFLTHRMHGPPGLAPRPRQCRQLLVERHQPNG